MWRFRRGKMPAKEVFSSKKRLQGKLQVDLAGIRHAGVHLRPCLCATKQAAR